MTSTRRLGAERSGERAALTTDVRVSGTMRALVQHTYGGPEVLQLAQAPRPVPGPSEVLVRVAASSVNARDWHVMRGEPRLARLFDRTHLAPRAPRIAVRGTDFAGVVDAVGPGVSRWRPGEAVLGEAHGAWAEYVVASQDALAAVPASVSFEVAAALPLAATTALSCLAAGNPRPGDRLLVNGASGGVGTFALQIARAQGLAITAVCSARNAEQATSLGADIVVDYRSEDFCRRPERYDIVLDLVGNRRVNELRRLLRPNGTLVLSGGGVPGTGRYIGPLAMLARAQLLALRPGPRIAIPQVQPTAKDLENIAQLVLSGDVGPIVDRVLPLERGSEAVRYMEGEHAKGKVVLAVWTPRTPSV